MKIITNIPKTVINNNNYNLNLNSTGGNSGNLLFWESLKNICKINNSTLYSLEDIDNIDYEMVILIFANVIKKDVDLNNILFTCNFKKNIKKIIISLGSQNNNNTLFSFTELQKNIFSKTFDNFDYICLRGNYTYNLLKYNNINTNNIIPLGCPSITLNDIDFNILEKKFKQLNKNSKILINIPEPSTHYYYYKQLIYLSTLSNCYTIIQDNIYFVNFAESNNCRDIIKNSCKDFGDDIIKNYKNFKFFGNIINQLEFIKNNDFDFCIGTRIHGCISALLCNVPVLNLSIDSRTHELCDIMNIPYVNCVENNINIYNDKNYSIENLLDFINNNYKIDKKKMLEHINYQKKIYNSFFNNL